MDCAHTTDTWEVLIKRTIINQAQAAARSQGIRLKVGLVGVDLGILVLLYWNTGTDTGKGYWLTASKGLKKNNPTD